MEKNCATCLWWGPGESTTTIEPWNGARECKREGVLATGIHPSSGYLEPFFSLPTFGCNQWQADQ